MAADAPVHVPAPVSGGYYRRSESRVAGIAERARLRHERELARIALAEERAALERDRLEARERPPVPPAPDVAGLPDLLALWTGMVRDGKPAEQLAASKLLADALGYDSGGAAGAAGDAETREGVSSAVVRAAELSERARIRARLLSTGASEEWSDWMVGEEDVT